MSCELSLSEYLVTHVFLWVTPFAFEPMLDSCYDVLHFLAMLLDNLSNFWEEAKYLSIPVSAITGLSRLQNYLNDYTESFST